MDNDSQYFLQSISAEFKWDDVKVDKHRENYLGHSVKAPVGRWQKGTYNDTLSLPAVPFFSLPAALAESAGCNVDFPILLLWYKVQTKISCLALYFPAQSCPDL